jgi:hypothetical protein
MTLVYQCNVHVHAAPLDDSLVLLNEDTNHFHELGAVAPRIWELLMSPSTVADLVAVLTTEFEVSDEQCTAEVEAFLAQLQQRGLVTAR